MSVKESTITQLTCYKCPLESSSLDNTMSVKQSLT